MKRLLFILAALIIVPLSYAQITMPYVFSDHMVLQRNMDIPFWGTAPAGQAITIKLDKQTVTTTANARGEWHVRMPEFSAGGPYVLNIYNGATAKPILSFKDVLIGDVWLASGQSNMEWQVQQADGAENEIPHATNQRIRHFFVPHQKSLTEQSNTLQTEWKLCDTASVKSMSAVAYYFAKNLEAENNVPIGILQSSWGGTPVEAWTSREMLLSEPVIRKRVLDNDSLTYQHFVKDSLDLITFWDIVYNPKNGLDTLIPQPEFNDDAWRDVEIPGVISNWESAFYEGMIWLRKDIHLKKGFAKSDLTIHLGHPELNYTLYFNGVEICKTKWNAELHHTYTIPANLVSIGENTIVVRIAALWGGGGLNGPADAIYLTNGDEEISITGTWKYKKNLEPKVPKIYYYQQFPTLLFNGMIKPIAPYGLKGFIWYQGENNEGDAYNYRKLFPLMINDWRIRWQQGYLPFLFVQLPNYYKAEEQPSDGKWAVLRESQQEALRLPNTGMVCAIDQGEAENIHPTNKTEVSRRLTLVAQQVAYGKDIQASGPTFNAISIEGNKVVVRFKHVADGLNTTDNEQVTGFAIAGDDQQFYWAKATIEGETVVLTSDKVSDPVAVRYAWANNPKVNLINSTGLPAVPFRTDNWKVITQP